MPLTIPDAWGLPRFLNRGRHHVMFKIAQISDSTFSPAEVESFTGFTTVMQRDWRRRGYIDASEEGQHARFMSRTVASILVMRMFADVHVGPSISREFAAEAAACVMWYALDLNRNLLVVNGPPKLVQEYWESFDRNTAQIEKIVAIPLKRLGKYFVFESKRHYGIINDLQEVKMNPLRPVATIMDLEQLGKYFARYARKPLITVDLERARR